MLRPLISCILASTLIFGCVDQPTPAEPHASGREPTFGATNAPSASRASRGAHSAHQSAYDPWAASPASCLHSCAERRPALILALCSA
jgi:hypothetical protein